MAFFEQIGKRLTDTGQNVAQKSQNLVDVTRLNNEISDIEKKISQLFLEIGQAYYERHKYDINAEEFEKIEYIKSLNDCIISNREQIKQIKGVVKCEKCGADVPLSAAFCNVCGTKVNRTETPVSGKLCPVCHAVVEKDNAFCNYCGAKLETNE